MKKVTTFANQKGGVGKTTCAMNIGYCLAEMGKSILFVDIDPQGNLTMCCGLNPESLEKTIYDVFKKTCLLKDIIARINGKSYIAPSNLMLASMERELFGMVGYESILKKALTPVLNDFDHIIIDTPPSLGSLTINGLVACNEVYITVTCEHLGLIGVNRLLGTIEAVRENYNQDITVGKVIPVMYSKTILAAEMLKQLESHFGDNLVSTRIRKNVKIGESSAVGQSIISYDPKSIGAKDFVDLVKELL